MIIESDYKSSFKINNGHFETILPYFFRTLPRIKYTRERIETDDKDFLDLDWVDNGYKSLVILSHGLEGGSDSTYNIGMAGFLSNHKRDVLVWNHRGCSGEPNNLITSYHSGFSQDLKRVINHILKTKSYKKIDLVGFSMGGNITLKYLGEEGENTPKEIHRAVAISTPVSLTDCSRALSSGFSRVYTKNFILMLVKKIEEKNKKFPDKKIDTKKLKRLWSFKKFDDRFTAPLYGYKNAEEYWEKCSSLPYLKNIQRQTLIINAQNDPFLHGECYPYKQTEDSEFVHLEVPTRGGHVGFPLKGLREFWTEKRTLEFLDSKY